jgi:uncharacterized protein
MRSVLIKRSIATLAVLAATVLVASVAIGWALARPVPALIGSPPPDLQAVAVKFPSESGSEVHGWWGRTSTRQGSVLLLPGVRANRLSMVDHAKFLHRAGYSVLLIDFQATGETHGREITFGWRESRDVLAAVHFIRTQAPDEPIAIIGSSLGGAAALLATPPLQVDACVLEAVYPTVERATNNRLRNYLGPIGPLGTPLLLMQLPMRIGVNADQLRPIDHIARASFPIFIINGVEDSRTTREDALLLYSRASSPKQLWLVPRAGHVDLHHAAPREYEARLLSFFSKAMHRRVSQGERASRPQ